MYVMLHCIVCCCLAARRVSGGRAGPWPAALRMRGDRAGVAAGRGARPAAFCREAREQTVQYTYSQ